MLCWRPDGSETPEHPGGHANHAAATWAQALTEPARYGWNAGDLNEIIDDWAQDTGIVADPTSPVAFLRWLLGRHDLAFSPTLLATARRDQAQVEVQARQSDAAPQADEAATAREAARLALQGPGRQLVRQALAHRRATAATRKAADIRAAHEARAEQIARARGNQ